MRPRYLAWVPLVLGASGGGLGLLGAAMLLLRAQCEPVVRLMVPVIMGRNGYYRYHPGDYFVWAGLVGALALALIGLSVGSAWRRPAPRKRIDAALWSRSRTAARDVPTPANPSH